MLGETAGQKPTTLHDQVGRAYAILRYAHSELEGGVESCLSHEAWRGSRLLRGMPPFVDELSRNPAGAPPASRPAKAQRRRAGPLRAESCRAKLKRCPSPDVEKVKALREQQSSTAERDAAGGGERRRQVRRIARQSRRCRCNGYRQSVKFLGTCAGRHPPGRTPAAGCDRKLTCLDRLPAAGLERRFSVSPPRVIVTAGRGVGNRQLLCVALCLPRETVSYRCTERPAWPPPPEPDDE